MSATPIDRVVIGGALIVAGLASVAWPLATYTLTLATFGLAHVLAELRYVDRRFGNGLGRALGRAMAVVLLGVMTTRGASMAGVLPGPAAIIIELGLGLSLVALVLPRLLRRHWWVGASGLVVASLVGTAILVAPAAGLLALAVLHNFTPIGFVLDATSGTARRRAAGWCTVLFVVVPLVIASGLPWTALASANLTAPELSPLGYGPLQDAMGAYLPVERLDPALALHLFCACVFLQCTHYVAVLLVLPRLVAADARGRLPWPSRRWWPYIIGAATLAVLPFALDFADARRGYGMLAAVHAWIEVPILLLALAGGHRNSHKP